MSLSTAHAPHQGKTDTAILAMTEPALTEKTLALAEDLLVTSQQLETASEARKSAKLADLLADPQGMELTFQLTDRILRTPDVHGGARLFRNLLATYGTPKSFPLLDRALLTTAGLGSRLLPQVVMPAITRRLREESREVILPARRDQLAGHLSQRRAEGARINLNVLGEAVLSEKEARDRLAQNVALLEDGTANYLSVKLSSLFSQINLTAYEESKETLKTRLRPLYRAAQRQSPAAFINLDMEEYRDLQLTADVFREVLMEEEFLTLRAGIVLQGYLPDSFPMQQALTDWARQRVAQGGAPIKVRLVKGANLAMERVDAESHHWELAPYNSKAEVDANYKRLVHYGMQPENAAAVHLGIASHNLFDLAYALVLRDDYGVREEVEIEMLEGMAPPQARAVLQRAGQVLFYTPIVRHEEFEASIAYLVRRLDENTTPGNFLRDLFQLAPDSMPWQEQKEAFLAACQNRGSVPSGPKRQQNRQTEEPLAAEKGFANCPDTDFSLPANRQWLDEVLARPVPGQPPLVTTREEVSQALERARQSTWADTPATARQQLLRQVAVALAEARGDLIAVMVAEGKKAPAEADVEVSEAIDFANYYAHSLSQTDWQDGLAARPLGPIVIASPWNFPCAIPCGGILAALAAGNTALLKPAPEALATAQALAKVLWAAGLPRDAFQFLPLPDNEVGQSLITDERVAGVILTGSSQTAQLFLGWRPDLRLHAETSGKNALIISASADPDLAIKDLVRSAFGHTGQKCSAASLALVERSVLEKTNFLERLKDAAASLEVGPHGVRSSLVTPLVQEPSPDLARGLAELDSGEEWLLEPQCDSDDPCLWSPGIRLGVEAGSWLQQTELFGPVLGIIAYDDLEEAIAIQNSSDFGLTGGIHSLDPQEIAFWRDKVEVGNAYINRTITGAIVQRQPFGGWKKSAVGPGAKAGGPNYVAQFSHWQSVVLPSRVAPLPEAVDKLLKALLTRVPDAAEELHAAAGNAAYWWQQHFAREHDPSGLLCEKNDFRYRPVRAATFRVTSTSTARELAISALMARTAGVPLTVSSAQALPPALESLTSAAGLDFQQESDEALAARLTREPLATLRTPGRPHIALAWRNHHHPVTAHARLELLPYLLEQSVSETNHRHGRPLDNRN
ncbi:proline dehydrogenase family protein [Roseibacillus ishigakijimensis]|uniref:L-glutamate gamma-semialdehyde dehydrogenase n=1 Tax=Roseibacillus ishigakijimensis TaxID=454146 RepID=A0A934VKV3_9BACT|nr:proline dehydrogenase family protein [Roseibacillus ishigakijimensis]MBK1832562.1 proline dehydrogenase family protein [Roseibacillus ishigakijimensis]